MISSDGGASFWSGKPPAWLKYVADGYSPWPIESNFGSPLSVRDYPWSHDRIEITREEWNKTQLISPKEISPEMNAIGLMWRPAPVEASNS